jgi:hypothetical protein
VSILGPAMARSNEQHSGNEHLREIAEKIRELARQTPIREAREELFDLADRLDQMAGLAKRGPIARRRFWTSGGGSGAGSSADERGAVVPIEVDDRVTAH